MKAEQKCPKCVAPGVYICDKCGFTQFKNVLYVQSGNIGADTKPHLEPCPNDGRDMRPVTWEERCKDIAQVCEQQIKRAVDAESELTTLRQRVQQVEDALKPFAKVGEHYLDVVADDKLKMHLGMFTVGELRAAAHTLAPTIEKKEGEK